MLFIGTGIAATAGAVLGYAFRGLVRKDIAKVIAAVRTEETKATTIVKTEETKIESAVTAEIKKL